MSRMVTRTDKDFEDELIEKTAKHTSESIIKTLEESGIINRDNESKVSRILRKAENSRQTNESNDQNKNVKLDEERIKVEEEKKNLRIEEEKKREILEKKLEESEVFCPTCSGSHDHKHTLKKTNKGTLKCEDGNCSMEYFLIPDADYKCEDCGKPKKKPTEKIDNDKCPFCGSDKFNKYDWTKEFKKEEKKKGWL